MIFVYYCHLLCLRESHTLCAVCWLCGCYHRPCGRPCAQLLRTLPSASAMGLMCLMTFKVKQNNTNPPFLPLAPPRPRSPPDGGTRSSTLPDSRGGSSGPPPAPGRTAGSLSAAAGWSRAPDRLLETETGIGLQPQSGAWNVVAADTAPFWEGWREWQYRNVLNQYQLTP